MKLISGLPKNLGSDGFQNYGNYRTTENTDAEAASDAGDAA